MPKKQGFYYASYNRVLVFPVRPQFHITYKIPTSKRSRFSMVRRNSSLYGRIKIGGRSAKGHTLYPLTYNVILHKTKNVHSELNTQNYVKQVLLYKSS